MFGLRNLLMAISLTVKRNIVYKNLPIVYREKITLHIVNNFDIVYHPIRDPPTIMSTY